MVFLGMRRPRRWRLGSARPAPLPKGDSLDAPALRSVGESGALLAARTGAALTRLAAEHGAHVFRGVHLADSRPPVVVDAIARGRVVVFIVSVAWPVGHYHHDADGRMRCDGIYIGQSVGPLREAVQRWRARLRRHRVGVLVVVHPDGTGDYLLPACTPDGIEWTMADHAIDRLRNLLPRGRGTSRPALGALAAAAVGPYGQ
jgi:hypothetical protein